MQQTIIAPSVLSADFARLGEACQAVLAAGADWIHLDVMDNHYVPNLTVGPMVCQALRDYGITAPIDVHLMVTPVDSLVPLFAKAGATYISFHPEASLHPHRTILMIRDQGCRPGLAFNPGSLLEPLEYLLDYIDMVLIMSVNPGFGGQQFIPESLHKLQKVRAMLDKSERPIRLEVDGGVTIQNIAEIQQAGADTFVAGSAIFNTPDYHQTLSAFKQALRKTA